MRQLVGAADDTEGAPTTVRELLVSLAPAPVRAAAPRLAAAERQAEADPMRYATALADWGDHGGYDAEVLLGRVHHAAPSGSALTEVADRPLRTFSGGEQKRIALEVLLRGDDDILLLDEPDNFLDVPGQALAGAGAGGDPQDRPLRQPRPRAAGRHGDAGSSPIEAEGAWTHGGGFAGYAEARQAHLDKLSTRPLAGTTTSASGWRTLVAEMSRRAKISETFAPKLKAAESRLRQFDEKQRATRRTVREQRIDMRLGGARTGKRAVIIEGVELDGLTDPFDLELWFGERVAVLGGNGVGKSHFLRLLGRRHDGRAHRRRGGSAPASCPGCSTRPTSTRSGRAARCSTSSTTTTSCAVRRWAMLRRYELQGCAEQPFDTLSGGQQARFQILLLERSGATLLLLDEPTDNLDLVSAEALEAGLAQFTGTVIAVTHDRWFLRGFDRFVVFGADCSVTDHLEVPPAWR